MNKSDVRDTLEREIAYRLQLIDECKAGKLLAFSTPEAVQGYCEEQFTKIDEVKYIAMKLHVTLNKAL